jgi:hypothetical protein
MELPSYVGEVNGILYCFLENEIDKKSFEGQCNKCPLKEICVSKKDIYKNVAGDWHSLNASGLYGDEFDKCTDKYKRKDLRGVAKIVGLALCYGGSAYTVSGNMGTTKAEAQVKIDNFFRKLSTLEIYMYFAKEKVLEHGKVYNLFGRCRDMSKWAFSNRWKDKMYSQRVALNHPIQSTSAEVLKILMIRVDEYIENNGLSLIYGLGVPQNLDLTKVSYRDMIVHELLSTHDEVDSLFNQNNIDQLLPVLYEIMQIKDVIGAFNVGFDLELDCEYDIKNRSLIASNSYLNSKIFVVNNINRNKLIGSDVKANTIVIDFNLLDQEKIKQILECSEDAGDSNYKLAINSGDVLYIHENLFSLDKINELGVKYTLAYAN